MRNGVPPIFTNLGKSSWAQGKEENKEEKKKSLGSGGWKKHLYIGILSSPGLCNQPELKSLAWAPAHRNSATTPLVPVGNTNRD